MYWFERLILSLLTSMFVSALFICCTIHIIAYNLFGVVSMSQEDFNSIYESTKWLTQYVSDMVFIASLLLFRVVEIPKD